MKIAVIALSLLLAACGAAPAASSPGPASPTPQFQLGTLAATRSPEPTPSARPSPTITKTTQEATLVLADMPAGFKLSADKAITADDLVANDADKAASKQELLTTRGFVEGWLREYTRDALFGAVFIRSSATRYAAADGAKWGIARNVQTTTQQSGGIQVSTGETLGDESYGIQLDTTSGQTTATTYVIYFRAANVSNTVAVAGVKGTIDISTVVDLAKKQLARLRA